MLTEDAELMDEGSNKVRAVGYGTRTPLAFITPWGDIADGVLVTPIVNNNVAERERVKWGLRIGGVRSPEKYLGKADARRFKNTVYVIYDPESLNQLRDEDEKLLAIERELTAKQLQVAEARKHRLAVYANVCHAAEQVLDAEDLISLKDVAVGLGPDVTVLWEACQ